MDIFKRGYYNSIEKIYLIVFNNIEYLLGI